MQKSGNRRRPRRVPAELSTVYDHWGHSQIREARRGRNRTGNYNERVALMRHQLGHGDSQLDRPETCTPTWSRLPAHPPSLPAPLENFHGNSLLLQRLTNPPLSNIRTAPIPKNRNSLSMRELRYNRDKGVRRLDVLSPLVFFSFTILLFYFTVFCYTFRLSFVGAHFILNNFVLFNTNLFHLACL